VQKLTTIGYGTMSPESHYAHSLVAVEALIGLLGMALVTGLVFAKASRPQASVLFSDVAVIGTRDGRPTFEFRMGNARGNDVVEATVRLTALRSETMAEGHTLRKLHDMELVRERSPIFAMSWTVMHVIDEDSPIHGFSMELLDERDVWFIVTMTGWDLTYANTVHSRKLYQMQDIRSGVKFVDVMSRQDDGRMRIDFRRFHDVEPLDEDGSQRHVTLGGLQGPPSKA